jgi:hypothetical protein
LAPPEQPGKQVTKPDERLRKLDLLLQLAQSTIAGRRRWGSPNDDTFLMDSLCLLHVATREVKQLPIHANEADLLKGLAERRWQRPVGEPWRAYLTRLIEQAEQGSDQTNRRLAGCKQEYAELTKDPWPFAWQARRAMWLDLVELMLATKSGEDRQAQWQAAADKHASEGDLFRKAYVVSVRVSPKPSLDWEFVQPAVANWGKSRDPDRLRWCVETLDTLLAEGGDPQRPGGKEVAELLLRTLRDEGGVRLPRGDELPQALGRLYRSADERGQPEAAAILSAMLNTADGVAFRIFADAAGMSPERRRAVLLATPVRLPDEGTLEQRLRTILDQTGLRVWIDDTVPHLLDTSVHRQDARSDCGDAQCAAFLADSAVAGRRLVH